MLRNMGKSTLLGAFITLAFVLVSMGLATIGFPYLMVAFIFSGVPLSYAAYSLLPSSAVYAVVPEGGAPAAVGIPLVVAFFQATVLLSVIFYRRAKAQPGWR